MFWGCFGNPFAASWKHSRTEVRTSWTQSEVALDRPALPMPGARCECPHSQIQHQLYPPGRSVKLRIWSDLFRHLRPHFLSLVLVVPRGSVRPPRRSECSNEGSPCERLVIWEGGADGSASTPLVVCQGTPRDVGAAFQELMRIIRRVEGLPQVPSGRGGVGGMASGGFVFDDPASDRNCRKRGPCAGAQAGSASPPFRLNDTRSNPQMGKRGRDREPDGARAAR